MNWRSPTAHIEGIWSRCQGVCFNPCACFRHLDLDSDGFISGDEVEELLKELEVPRSRLPPGAAPQHSIKVAFAEFLELHRQV